MAAPTAARFLLLFSLLLPPAAALNLTALLSDHPNLSHFSALLSSSAADLAAHPHLTLLAVPNPLLPATTPAAALRHHILLRYLSPPDLRRLPPSGQLLPTLNLGPLNISFNPSNDVVSILPPFSPNPNPNPPPPAQILSFVKSIPFNLSIFTVSALISPLPSDLVTSEARPPSPNVNITKALIDGHGFNVAASLLAASGVVDEFEADESGAGITLFVPSDSAFANLPPTVQLQALPADRKALVLKFHVLHSYYPLGSLDSIVNPVQPTLATEDNGAGSFTLNISKINGSVALNSGVVQAVVTQTVFDQNPVAIFGISHVLLPREIFGELKGRGVNLGMRNSSGGGAAALPPEIGAAPEKADSDLVSPSSLTPSPVGSDSGGGAKRWSVALLCTVGSLYVLVV